MEKQKSANKKFVRYKDGAELYSLGIQNFMKIAKEAGAVRKIRGTVLVNTEKLDAYIDKPFYKFFLRCGWVFRLRK